MTRKDKSLGDLLITINLPGFVFLIKGGNQMNWIKIIIASIFEIGWVLGLTHAKNPIEIIGTIIAIIISFYLLINASKNCQ